MVDCLGVQQSCFLLMLLFGLSHLMLGMIQYKHLLYLCYSLYYTAYFGSLSCVSTLVAINCQEVVL